MGEPGKFSSCASYGTCWNSHAPITIGALNRNESRGAHYKPEFPERDDENFLKTTLANWSSDGPRFSWEAVDTSLIPLRARRYDVDTSHAKAKAA